MRRGRIARARSGLRESLQAMLRRPCGFGSGATRSLPDVPPDELFESMKGDLTITWRLPDGQRLQTTGWTKLNLLGHADTFDLEIPQACGGHAECGTCRIRILSGELTPIRHEEGELMTRHAKRFGQGERLSCQCRPLSDVEVEVLSLMPPDLRDLEDQ